MESQEAPYLRYHEFQQRFLRTDEALRPSDMLSSPEPRDKLVININDDGILLSNVQASVSVQVIDARQITSALEREVSKGRVDKNFDSKICSPFALKNSRP